MFCVFTQVNFTFCVTESCWFDFLKSLARSRRIVLVEKVLSEGGGNAALYQKKSKGGDRVSRCSRLFEGFEKMKDSKNGRAERIRVFVAFFLSRAVAGRLRLVPI